MYFYLILCVFPVWKNWVLILPVFPVVWEPYIIVFYKKKIYIRLQITRFTELISYQKLEMCPWDRDAFAAVES